MLYVSGNRFVTPLDLEEAQNEDKCYDKASRRGQFVDPPERILTDHFFQSAGRGGGIGGGMPLES